MIEDIQTAKFFFTCGFFFTVGGAFTWNAVQKLVAMFGRRL